MHADYTPPARHERLEIAERLRTDQGSKGHAFAWDRHVPPYIRDDLNE
jgi:hypothetical protein